MNEQDIQDLANWGFNFVRLGVMWEAVERLPGLYNETYLDEVEKLINALGAKGIYTLVDAHQDVGARYMCGQGFPNFYAKEVIEAKSGSDGIPYCLSSKLDWLVKPMFQQVGLCQSIKDYGHRLDEDGNPLIKDCQKVPFVFYYTTTESQALFEALYHNELGLQDKFLAFWDRVSGRFASNQYVIGFDPINEPIPASFVKDPFLIQPYRFDLFHLKPLYEKVFEKYQKNNFNQIDKNIMHFEAA